MENEKKKKLCLSCSAGGHLTQLTQLKSFYAQYDYFFITEDIPITREMSRREKVRLLKLINRKMWNFGLLFVYNTALAFFYLLRERPDVIISTGALSTVPVCYLGKLMGKKVVFIESYAKVTSPTLSGRLVYKIADLFIVQWEELRAHYPKSVYGGSIY